MTSENENKEQGEGKVVPMFANVPRGNLLDIPAQLRMIADRIESEGESPEVLIVIAEYKTNERPVFQQIGLARPDAHIVGIIETIKFDIMHD